MNLSLKIVFGSICSTVLAVNLWAEDGAQSSACDTNLKTYRDILSCAEIHAPELQIGNAELERLRAEVRAATQLPNPELSADTLRGGSGDRRNSETSLSVGFPILLGGKLSARESAAQAAVAEVQARFYETRAKIRSETLVKLHRLRQISHELEIIDEAIATFTKLVRQLSSRPTLSPEQRLSQAVFRMSLADYEVKRASVVEEMAALDGYFQVAIGMSVDQIESALPPPVVQWPEVQSQYTAGQSARSKTLQSEVETSMAALDLAKSSGWPDLTVGPSLRWSSQGGASNPIMWGVNLSFPLPIFNINGAAIAAATKGVNLAETRRYLAGSQEERDRESLLKTYNESKRVLSIVLSHDDIEKRHSEVESLFTRGIVPSALVIEAHRAYVELEQTRNEKELKALESLLSIYTIDGKAAEFSI